MDILKLIELEIISVFVKEPITQFSDCIVLENFEVFETMILYDRRMLHNFDTVR